MVLLRFAHAANNFRSGSRSPRSTARSTSTQRDPARLGEHARLWLDRPARRARPRHSREGRIEPDALQIAGQLLDGLDSGDPLDLDRDPAVLLVAAHEIDRADVGRPLAPDQPKALAAPVRLLGQQLLQVGLDAVLGQRVRRRPASPSRASTSERTSCELDLEPVLGWSRRACGRSIRLGADSSITVGGVIQFSGLTLWPPSSAHTMNVPSALIISSRVASARMGVEAAGVVDRAAGDDQAHRRQS